MRSERRGRLDTLLSRPPALALAAFAAAAALALAASPAAAQATASLSGSVSDPTRALVPGATVTLTNRATRFTRSALTDARGGYFFATVDPGDYDLSVELAGFKTHTLRAVHVSPNDTLGIDVSLDVGAEAELVEVVAERDLISTRSGAREGLLTAEAIQRHAMIGRNPMELMRILPGVVVPDQSAMEVVGRFQGPSSNQATTVNGSRGTNMMVTLDGAKLQDVGSNNGTLVVPNNEMVAEVKIQTSNYAAEFGNSAVSVQAVTKSGSSEFHGGFYQHARNQNLASNDRSRVLVGQPKPRSSFNFPGAYLSGPILLPFTRFNRDRDRAFFFAAVEVSRQTVDQGSSFSIVPTAGQREGLFDDYQGGQNLNQSPLVNVPSGFPGAGSPAAGNDLRPYVTDTGRRLLGLWPEANYEDPANRYNYLTGDLSNVDRDLEMLRVDYNLSEATRAYVRLARDFETTTRPRGLWWNSSDVDLPSAVRSTSLGRSVSLNVASVLSPSATNEFIFSWSSLQNENGWEHPAAMRLDSYGIEASFNPLGASPYVPQLVMRSNGGSLWSGNDVERIFSHNSFYMLADTLTHVMSNHALKAGFVVERWNKRQNFDNNANAQLGFSNDTPGGTGTNFGDLLVGRVGTATVGTPSAIGNFVGWSLEAFAQDSWKLAPGFTLEYGLRFAKWTNNRETTGLGSLFEPGLYDPLAGRFRDAARSRLNGFAYAADGEVSDALTRARPLLFMPRVNFVWELDRRKHTVVRGGAGLFYNREQGNAQYGVIQLPPGAYSARLDASSLTDLGAGRGLTYDTLPLADPFSERNGYSATSVSPDSLDWPRTLNASLSIARRLRWRQVLELGYVGSFGRHLAARQNANVIAPGTLLAGTLGNADLAVPVERAALATAAVDSRRPYAALENVVYYVQSGISSYHSLQSTLARSTGRFQYLLAYTFSKSLGTLGADQGLIDPFDPRNRSYGVLAGDRTHSAKLSWTWQASERATGGGWRKLLLKGWQLAGISTFASGAPIRLGFTGDIVSRGMSLAWWGTPDYTNAIMPVYTCDPRRPAGENEGRLLDIGCLGVPALGESGPYVQPYYLRSPSVWLHDLTLVKDIRLGDGARRRLRKVRLHGVQGIELRIGAFNVFNLAYPIAGGDLDVALDTRCNVRVDGVPDGSGGSRDDVCDPSRGFSFTPQTLANFGRVALSRGHRVIGVGAKVYF